MNKLIDATRNFSSYSLQKTLKVFHRNKCENENTIKSSKWVFLTDKEKKNEENQNQTLITPEGRIQQ